MRSWTRSVTCGWSGKSSSSVRSTVQSNVRRPRGHASCIVVARDMSLDDLWYKNAIIYCLDVEKYQDANGDGIGDFEGLMRRLDYLAGPRRDLRVAPAVLPLTEPRQRVRRCRLLWRQRQTWVARRLRRLHAARRGARHARDRRPGRQPHVDRLALVPAGARRPEVLLPRLVCLVRHASQESQRGHRLSRAADDDLDEGSAGEASTTSIASTITSPT